MESPDSIVDPTHDTADAAVTADAEVIDLTTSDDAPAWAPEADASTDAPSVDALEEQLGSLQGAMDKLQAGDLDGAERTIEALEQKIVSLKN